MRYTLKCSYSGQLFPLEFNNYDDAEDYIYDMMRDKNGRWEVVEVI